MNAAAWAETCGRLLRSAVALAALASEPGRAGYGGDGPTAGESAWTREHVGMYVWGPGAEKELKRGHRRQLADMALRLGTRIVRGTITMYPEPWRPEYDPARPNWIDHLRTPGWRELIAGNDVVFLTLGDGSGRQFDPEWTGRYYRLITEYLLREYAAVPKVFVLGFWEGDHWLTEASMASDPANVAKYAAWCAARHSGIAAGQAAVPGSASRVREMIEIVRIDYGGEEYLINRVLPKTRADLYSLSSWGYQEQLPKALDYMASMVPPSLAFGRANCMVGEAGGLRSWAPAGERLRMNREILAGAREWGAPYVIWWQLCGALDGMDSPLRAPAYAGGVKLAPYYWFYRAYHDADDPLVIESFEVDPHGPPAGDRSLQARPLNLIGGERTISGALAACLVPGGNGSERCLYLGSASDADGWSTGLMELDAHRFGHLQMSFRGNASGLTVALTDAAGGGAGVEVAGGTDSWQLARVPLAEFIGVDIGGLVRLSIRPQPGTETFVDDIAFVGAGDRPAAAVTSGTDAAQAAQIAIRSGSEPVLVPGHEEGQRLGSVRFTTAADLSVISPRLTDGRNTLSMGDKLGPGQVLEVVPGATSYLRAGPLAYLLDVERPEDAGLTTRGLLGLPQYHAMQPADNEECWLQWHWKSDMPVMHFRIAAYGSVRAQSEARVSIRFSPDGDTWSDAELDERTWSETFWIGRAPEGFVPTEELWVRVELHPDRSVDDWPWTVSIGDLKVELWLDSADVRSPCLAGLRYEDDQPADGCRGLLDLDW